jgi:hypothetical protein
MVFNANISVISWRLQFSHVFKFYMTKIVFHHLCVRLGHDRMVVSFTTTYAVSAYHH